MTNMILAETVPAEIAAENAVPAAGGSVTVAVIAAVTVIVVIVIALIVVAIVRLRRKAPDSAATVLAACDAIRKGNAAVPTLTLETVLKFFKEVSRLKILRENADLLAVAVKREAKDGETTVVTLCLFDKKKGELFEPETHAILYVAGALGNDLAEQFGDKDMITFQ